MHGGGLSEAPLPLLRSFVNTKSAAGDQSLLLGLSSGLQNEEGVRSGVQSFLFQVLTDILWKHSILTRI